MLTRQTVLAVLLMSTALTSAGWGQTPSSVRANGGTEEVVVTARRRAENVEKVPIAVAAIRAKDIAARNIVTEQDLELAVPGLTVNANANANSFNFTIRGQSVDTYSNSAPAVLTYVNEAPILTHSASSYYDLGGIQVLKGPQGTLFGRNTTGGAVLYDTVAPGDKYAGYLLTRFGNYGLKHVEVGLSVPISDKVAFRVAGDFTDGGGYVHNTFNNTYLGDQDYKSVRGTLVIKPVAGVTNTTVVQYTEEGGNNIPDEQYSAYPCGSTINGAVVFPPATCLAVPGNPLFDAYVAAHPGIYPGGIVALTAQQRAEGPWTVDENYPSPHSAHSTFVINTTDWEVSPSLTVKNIASYNITRSSDGIDYDGSPYALYQTGLSTGANLEQPVGTSGYLQRTQQFSEELQVQGKALDERLTYVLGGFYSYQRDHNISNVAYYGIFPFGGILQYNQKSTDQSEAGFGQATYKVFDRLNVTGGVRYTFEQQTATQQPGSLFGTGVPVERVNSHDPSWFVSLDSQVLPSLLAYVTTRGSWRTGGYNFSVNPANVPASQGGNLFFPEETQDVELGAKYQGRQMGFPVTLNVDVYNQWVTNVQRAAYIASFSGATLFTANVPRAVTQGLELEASMRPLPWLTLGANGAVTDAHYTNGRLSIALDGITTVTRYGPFADVPKFSGNVYAQASDELDGDRGTITLRGDVYGQSSQNFSNTSGTVTPLTTLAGYSLTNGRLSWTRVMGSRFDAAMYVRNLFNRRYYIGGNAGAIGNGLNQSVGGQPRFFGGEVKVNL